MRVYAVRWEVEKKVALKDKPSKRGLWITALVIVAVMAVIGVVFWDKGKTPQKPMVEETTPPRVSEIPSIAVLPFRDMSPEKDQEYFCEGMAEEILNALVQIEGLRVAARTASFRLRDSDFFSIGEQLNVGTVLEGSVRKAGNKLRITAQLVKAKDSFHLWSETYDRDLKDVFAIQDEISQAITQVLHVKLMGEAGAPLVKTYTEITEAYDHYLQGRYHWMKRAKESLMTAKEHFEQAITLDPNYALAYSGLADVYLTLPFYTNDIKRVDIRTRAEAAAKKALAIDPDLAEAHTSVGWVRQIVHFDYKGAEREYQRAIELNPKYAAAHYRYSFLLMANGRFDEAIAEGIKVLELEPLSLLYNNALGVVYLFARQYDKAIQQFERTLGLDSKYANGWGNIGLTYFLMGKYEDAKRAFVRFAELKGENKEAMRHYVSLIEEHARTGEPVSPTPEVEIIFAKGGRTHILYANLGQKEKTLTLLEQYYEEDQYSGLLFLKIHPAYDFIRSKPRFIALMKKLGLEE